MVTNYYGACFTPKNSFIRNYEHNENFLAGYRTPNSINQYACFIFGYTEIEYLYTYRDFPDAPGNSRDTTLKFAVAGTLTSVSIHLHNHSTIRTPTGRLKGK
jgi:hypothetical protein